MPKAPASSRAAEPATTAVAERVKERRRKWRSKDRRFACMGIPRLLLLRDRWEIPASGGVDRPLRECLSRLQYWG
ncbi:hypothetical protein RE9425_13530 [Prescottella equi]|nr:hypothetical protein RE9425_13530 [Prescottella equi]